MANEFRLTLDCNYDLDSGDFDDYFQIPGRQFSFGISPQGQVWWIYDSAQSKWIPTPFPNKTMVGDPRHAKPQIEFDSPVSIWVRDNNQPVVSVEVSVVFGRVRGKNGQAPIASPFRDHVTRTVFSGPAAQERPGSEWFVFDMGKADYPHWGVHIKKSFSCYIGAKVTYQQNGDVRYFGLDPDLEVEDYGPQTNVEIKNP